MCRDTTNVSLGAGGQHLPPVPPFVDLPGVPVQNIGGVVKTKRVIVIDDDSSDDEEEDGYNTDDTEDGMPKMQ